MDPVAAVDLPASSSSSPTTPTNTQVMKYSTYLGSSQPEAEQPDSNTIGGIMNGVIKEKLKIIPKNLEYVSYSIIAIDPHFNLMATFA